MSRQELEKAYLAAIPEIYRESTAKLIAGNAEAYSDDYLRARLAPPPKAARGPKIARHCNDNGAS